MIGSHRYHAGISGKGIQMTQITYETTIDAPASRVWTTLCAFDSYPEWNPFIVRASGQPAIGSHVEIVIVTPQGRELRFNPTIRELLEGERLIWTVGMPLPRLFDREISFEVYAVSHDVARFVHTGTFRGVLVPFRSGLIKDLELGYRRMNFALKERCGAAA